MWLFPYLGTAEVDKVLAKGSAKGEEGDGRPAEEIREDEQRHAFGHTGVIGVPSLGVADTQVHAQVAGQDDAERYPVENQDETHVT